MSHPVLDPTSGRERRRARRYPLQLPVKVLYGSSPVEAQFGFTSDVSSLGALLLLPREIAPGTDLQVRISWPRDLSDIRSQFVDMMASATVARLLPHDHRAAVGVAILSLMPVGGS